MKRFTNVPKRRITGSRYDSRSGRALAIDEIYEALRNLYRVMSRWEGNLEQILDDPTYFEATIDEIRYFESAYTDVFSED